MAEKLVITIPSRGRPHNTTFKLVEKAKCPVYIYIHEPEYRIYKECVPEHFIIVPHNYNNIGQIRGFIQKQQAEAGNAILMLDDDIRAFYQDNGLFKDSINTIIEKIEDVLNKHEIFVMRINTIMPTSLKNPILKTNGKIVGVSYVLRPLVYQKGIMFLNDSDISEDIDFTLQSVINKIDIAILPFICNSRMGEQGYTYFGREWYSTGMINCYKKYGNLISLFNTNSNVAAAEMDFHQIENYLLRGNTPLYSVKSNEVIQDLLKHGQADPSLFNVLAKISGRPSTNDIIPPLENREYWNYCPYKEIK